MVIVIIVEFMDIWKRIVKRNILKSDPNVVVGAVHLLDVEDVVLVAEVEEDAVQIKTSRIFDVTYATRLDIQRKNALKRENQTTIKKDFFVELQHMNAHLLITELWSMQSGLWIVVLLHI